MSRQLPPLNALRAFEAAARHLSFTQAAQELHVTQSAISRHIKGLEDYLEIQLFHRGPQRLQLTEPARALLPTLTECFDRMAQTVGRVKASQRELRIKLLPTLAIRWVIPRLRHFQMAHPDIQVRLTTAWHNVDFSREDFDAGIVYGAAERPGLRQDLILYERMIPVCAPGLLQGPIPLQHPSDLKQHTLLHPTPTHRDWREWLKCAGVNDVDPDQGMEFDLDEMALQAAIGGHGVTLANPLFVADDIKAGRLVVPFTVQPMQTGAYYLVCPEALTERPKVMAFRQWLLDEAKEN